MAKGITFLHVEAQNFLSFEELSIPLDQRGLVLVEGKNLTSDSFDSNGSGKSASLLDTISWVLFNRTPRDLKADEVISDFAEKDTFVKLKVQKDDDVYRIERYRKHSTHKNKVFLFVNDKDITAKSDKATNSKILKAIGVDYHTYTNTIVFGQGNVEMFSKATDKGRKDILESLVNLRVYSVAQRIAKEDLNQKNNDKTAKESYISSQRQRVEDLEAAKQENQRLVDQNNARIQEVEQKLTNIESEAKAAIPDLDAQKKDIQSKKEEQQSYLTNNGEEDQRRKSDLHTQLQNLQQQIQEHMRKANVMDSELRKMANDYRNTESNTHCQLCGNVLDDKHRFEELERLKTSMRETASDMASEQEEVEKLKQHLPPLENEMAELQGRQDSHNQAMQAIYSTIQVLDREMQQIDQQKQEFKNRYTQEKSTLDSLKSIVYPDNKEKIKEVTEGIATAEDELKTINTSIIELEKVVKVFSNDGVKSHVLDHITPFLNERANKYIQTLSGGNMEIKFTTQKENKDSSISDKFEIEVVNTTGGNLYKKNSVGERQRMDVAIYLAIQDLLLSKDSLKTNFVLYDEVFDGLDAIGCENVIELLESRLEDVSSIFVITHNDRLKSLFPDRMTIEKRGRVSRVVEKENVNA